MSIDKDKIKHISKLARISIDSKKSDSLATEDKLRKASSIKSFGICMRAL